MEIPGNLGLKHLKTIILLNLIILDNFPRKLGFMHFSHLHSGINIDSRLIKYIFSSFMGFRKQREIIPLRFKDCL